MNQKGFIQIPILIAIIVGILAIGGGSYFGYTQLKSPEALNDDTEEVVKPLTTEEEIAKLQQQIAELEKQTAQSEEIESLKKEVAALKAKPIKTELTNAEIAEKIRPAVVYVKTSDRSGSGMIIDNDGLILTNAHVVEGVNKAEITMSDKKSFIGSVVGRDENIDLALLKINGSGFPMIEFGDSDEDILRQGDEVFTFGYPLLEGDVSFKEGTISRRQAYEGITYLETSAEVLPGNSGGPLVNRFGQIIGVNTMVFGYIVKGVAIGETLKWAIPVNTVKDYLPELKSGKNVLKYVPLSSQPTPTPQPQPQPVCVLSSDYPNLYYNGTDYYYDDQCSNRSVYCLKSSKYPGYYYNYKTGNYYHDWYCGQLVVAGCKKSKTYSGKFYKPGEAWYLDSECTWKDKSMTCPPYPSSSGYICTDRSDFDWKLGYCDYYRMYKWTTYAYYCDELPQCENDYNEYQKKLNEYNDCVAEKEY